MLENNFILSSSRLVLYTMLLNYLPILFILAIFALLAVKAKKLTPVAGLTGWLTGLMVFAGAGYTGIVMMATFFILGTSATSWGFALKQRLGIAEKDKGRRTAGQVIANAGVAAVLGVAVVINNANADLFRMMLASAFASATADTLSSELGNVYGKSYLNIVTFKKDTRGLDGVISVEGTLAGLAGSTVIAIVYSLGNDLTLNFLWIILAGTIGNIFDSLLGATLERKGYVGNNQVNFLNTAIAALSALLLYLA